MILVTGDVVLDHNVYEGGRLSPDAPPGNGSHYEQIPGGAFLTYGLLHALDPGDVRFGLGQTTKEQLLSLPDQFQTRALWHAVGGEKPKDPKHWALERYLGYGEPKKAAKEEKAYPCDPFPGLNDAPPAILVIDDGGLGFREAKACWPEFLQKELPPELEWIILKMSRPLASGELWRNLMRDSWRERLIVMVSADELRSEGLRVAGGLSWETSVDDIVEELESNRALRGLLQCRHLVVTMRGDAALWLDQPGGKTLDGKPGDAHCQLIFDRKLCEGEWGEKNKDWKAYGFQSIMTASVAWFLSEALREKKNPEGKDQTPADQVEFTVSLAAGLSGTRLLREMGHGLVANDPGFPFAEAAKHLRSKKSVTDKVPNFSYSSAEVRCEGGVCRIGDKPLTSGHWTILGQVSPWHASHQKVPYEPARHIALYGPDKLPGVPCATFGKLQTLDRNEIDSLRSLRQLMLMYRDGDPRKQPLCLAVFGKPGSGKSFGLKQIAAGVFGEKAPVIEFNLSQFSSPADLIGAFHQVRDKVLSGITPIVFWDEFDSENLKWLRYLLAPMQDGQFLEGQVTHFVGKSVFVFAGGTSYTFNQFASSKDDPDFKQKKLPDFISRLSGYLDIAGPNPREVTTESLPDREFPVRRAMVIRIALELGDGQLQIERGLLTALLAVGRYCNGARSLDKLVNYIKDRGGMPLRRAYLPPDDILAMHVEDVKEFHHLTRKYAAFYQQADLLAAEVHDIYLKGLKPEQMTRPNAKPWQELTPDIRESNIAAALRVPEILELAGLTLVEGGSDDTPGFSAITEINNNIEMMAEAEHGGWEEQKRIDGWTFARNRNDEALRHHLLIPYKLLKPEDQEFDRKSIRSYPTLAGDAGFKIVPLPKTKSK